MVASEHREDQSLHHAQASEAPQQAPQNGSRLSIPVAAAALLLVLIAAWSWVTSPVVNSGDAAQQLLHAQALAEGRPYGDTGYLFSYHSWSVGPRLYPIGLPITLAPLLTLFGPHTVAVRALTYGFLGVLAVATMLALRGRRGTELALAAATLAAGALLIAGHGNRVLADLGAAALMWTVIGLVDASRDTSKSGAFAVLAIGGAAILYRPTSIVIAPAYLVHSLWTKKSVVRTLPTIALWGLLFWVANIRYGLGRPAVPPASLESTGAEPLGGFTHGLGAQVGRVIANADSYLYETLATLLYPFPWDIANDVYHVAALLITACGAALWAWRDRTTMAAIATGGYLASLALVPVASGRYLWPVVPGIAFSFCLGLAAVFKYFARRSIDQGARLTLVIVLGLVGAATLTAELTRQSEPFPDERLTIDSFGAQYPDATGFASNRARVLTWYTGVPGLALSPEPESVWAVSLLEYPVSHLVLDARTDPEVRQRWRAIIGGNPEVFRPVEGVGFLSAWQIDRDALAARSQELVAP